ncbi:THAP-type domain-containing protein, partial [Aphis craccivora]
FRYHFKKEDMVDTWESGTGFSKYTICLKKPRLVKDAFPLSLNLLFAASNVQILGNDFNFSTDVSQKSNSSSISMSSKFIDILVTNIKNEHCYSILDDNNSSLINVTHESHESTVSTNTSGELSSQLNDDLFILPSPKRMKIHKALDFQKLLTKMFLLKPPEKWYYDVSDTKIKVLSFYKLGPYRHDFTRAVEKQFVFTENLQLILYVYNKKIEITDLGFISNVEVKTHEDLQNVIEKFNEIKVCHGSVSSSQFNDIKSSFGHQFVESYGVWRHLKCSTILKDDAINGLEELLKDSNISNSQSDLAHEIFRAAKIKNPKNRRYSENWMLLCMLLQIRSPSGYSFLRNNKILPLPCPNSIRAHLLAVEIGCGFDKKIFKLLKKKFMNKSEQGRQGVIVVDEVFLRESISVNSRTLSYIGLEDYGDEIITNNSQKEKANHALVYMWQSLADNLVQPIAVFVTKGTVKGIDLAKLTIKAIMLMENAGGQVVGLTTDGASTNRTMWGHLGISAKLENFQNYFQNPYDSSRNIFVFSDAPHLLKTIRNRLYEKKTASCKYEYGYPPSLNCK